MSRANTKRRTTDRDAASNDNVATSVRPAKRRKNRRVHVAANPSADVFHMLPNYDRSFCGMPTLDCLAMCASAKNYTLQTSTLGDDPSNTGATSLDDVI